MICAAIVGMGAGAGASACSLLLDIQNVTPAGDDGGDGGPTSPTTDGTTPDACTSCDAGDAKVSDSGDARADARDAKAFDADGDAGERDGADSSDGDGATSCAEQRSDAAVVPACLPLDGGDGGCITVRQLAAGQSHTCALLSDRTVRCWGSNEFGQLGNGVLSDAAAPDGAPIVAPVTVPVPVANLTGALAITAGDDHSCALLAGGTVRCWGRNASGELGNGTTSDSPVPTAVKTLSTAIGVAAGGANGSGYTCALVDGGTIDCWGRNGLRQLGVATSAQIVPNPITVSTITTATAVAVPAAEGNHTCAVLSGGTLDCWGDNRMGELGIGELADDAGSSIFSPTPVPGVSGVTQVRTGSQFTCALFAEGTVECWGTNAYGELGTSTSSDACTPSCSPTPVPVSTLSCVSTISLGGSSSCAVLSNGGLDCWGLNNSGQIGNGTTSRALRPVAVQYADGTPVSSVASVTVGGGHACALLTSGAVLCFGADQYGQLGSQPAETCQNSTPCSFYASPVVW